MLTNMQTNKNQEMNKHVGIRFFHLVFGAVFWHLLQYSHLNDTHREKLCFENSVQYKNLLKYNMGCS